MTAEALVITVLAISFAATLFRSTFGFGEALIAVPLLSLFLPIDVAVPLSVMMSILVALIVVVQDHDRIHFKSAKWLIVFAAMGIPFGLLILFFGNEFYIKIALGVLIIAYGIYSLAGKNNLMLASDSKLWLFVCGFFSGVFGGAYGVNGPPLVVYGNMRRWDARYFRATLQAYFLPAGIISMAGYAAKGLVDATVLRYFLLSIPAVVPAVFLGRCLNKRIKGNSFYRYVYVGLVLIGGILIANSFLTSA